MAGKSIALACAFAVAFAAVADTVVFKSGSRLTGTVKRIQDGTVEFASDDVGDIKIPQDKIAELSTDKANTVAYRDDTRKDGVVASSNGAWTLDGQPLDMGGVKAVNPEEEKWHGSVNLSAAAARGNTVSESATVMADVARRWESDRLTADFGYFFAQSGDSRDSKRKTTDRLQVQGQEDHFWLKTLYTYVNGKYEFDRIQDLDYRYRVGVGLGYQWLEGRSFEHLGKWSFNQEVGISWVKERYAHVDDDDYATFRYAHHALWNPGWLAGLDFTHNFEYMPDVDDWADNYLIDTDIGFSYALISNWQLIGKFEWDYKSQTAPGTKHSDLRYTLGLGYKW